MLAEFFTIAVILLIAIGIRDAIKIISAWRRGIDSGGAGNPKLLALTLVDWLRIILAYGDRRALIAYLGTIITHVGVILLLVAHFKHFMGLIGLSPRGFVDIDLAITSGLMILVGATLTTSWSIVMRGLRAQLLVVKTLLVLTVIASLIELNVGAPAQIHPWLGVAAIYAALAASFHHFTAAAWLRPLLEAYKSLKGVHHS